MALVRSSSSASFAGGYKGDHLKIVRNLLIGLTGFAVGLGVALMCSPVLYKYADGIDSEKWPLLRVWPLGIAALLALPWLIGTGGRFLGASFIKSGPAHYSIALPLIPFGIAAGLMFVGVPAFTRVPAPPTAAVTHVKVIADDIGPQGFTVYFENDKWDLSPSDKARALAFALASEKCGVSGLTVRGYASSAEYPDDNEKQNLSLAERRAKSLLTALHRRQLVVEPDPWPNFGLMAKSKRFQDVAEGGKRIKEIEFMNRRAEARPKGDWTCLVH
jgi:hypothetical protein